MADRMIVIEPDAGTRRPFRVPGIREGAARRNAVALLEAVHPNKTPIDALAVDRLRAVWGRQRIRAVMLARVDDTVRVETVGTALDVKQLGVRRVLPWCRCVLRPVVHVLEM